MIEKATSARNWWLKALIILLPIIWFVIWYFAWFDHTDCLGALRQIGKLDPALYQSIEVECFDAARVRRSVELYGLIGLMVVELGLFIILRRSK